MLIVTDWPEYGGALTSLCQVLTLALRQVLAWPGPCVCTKRQMMVSPMWLGSTDVTSKLTWHEAGPSWARGSLATGHPGHFKGKSYYTFIPLIPQILSANALIILTLVRRGPSKAAYIILTPTALPRKRKSYPSQHWKIHHFFLSPLSFVCLFLSRFINL